MTTFEDRNKGYGTTGLGDRPKPSASTAETEPETTIESLQAEIKSLQKTVSDYVGSSAASAAEAVKTTTADVAAQISSTAAGAATAASDQAKTLTAELERVGRANPLGAIAGALLVGVLIGMIGRGRG